MEGCQIGNNTLDMSVLGDTHSNLKAEQWEPVTGILSQEINFDNFLPAHKAGSSRKSKSQKVCSETGSDTQPTTIIQLIGQNALLIYGTCPDVVLVASK